MVEEGSQGSLWVEIHIVDSLFFFYYFLFAYNNGIENKNSECYT